ncbi:MAG: ATP-binding protein [Flavobacteriales bacterium]
MTSTFTRYHEVVDGILSGYREVKGVRFMRHMCLTGIAATVMPLIGLPLLLPGAVELIWDRLLFIALAALAYFWGGRERVDARIYSKVVYTLYYIYSMHAIAMVWFNQFHPAYIILALVSVQMTGLSFRYMQHAAVFLAVHFTVFCSSLIYAPQFSFQETLLGIFITLICFGSCLLFVRFKTDFLENLKMNRDLLRSLINKTEACIFITNTQGAILDCNPRVGDMFGMTRDEMVGCDFRVLRCQPLTEEEIIFGLNELEKENFWNSETDLRRADGTEFHAIVSIVMIRRMDQRFFVYRVRDNSHVKQFELELFSAKERAEAAAAVRSQFLATMSHEIRTPLNGVVGMASLLDQTELDIRQKEYVDTIQKSGQSLMVLVNDILDYSKMESGRMNLRQDETHLADCLVEVCDLLRPHAEGKGIRLVVEVDSRIPRWVLTDEARLKQVLLNLVGNAVKFTEEGSIRVIARLENTLHDRVNVHFEVIDTGIGIPKERQPELFQPFTQVHYDASKKYGGTGLGLAISRQIVELLGGSMKLTSEAGKGSSFCFELALQVVYHRQGNSKSETVEDDELRKLGEARHIPILIAEDNLINQNVLLYMLETLGLKADVVSNGKDAIRQLSYKRYGLIFLDIQMPEMDGLLAASWIRAHSKYQPYIICMTANSSDEDRERCLAAGMDDFVPKPFNLARIREALVHGLERRKGSGERVA